MRLLVAENALRVEQSEKKFRAIFNNSSDGIYQSTFQGDFITANYALVKMMGLEKLDDLIVTRVPEYYKNPYLPRKIIIRVKKKWFG